MSDNNKVEHLYADYAEPFASFDDVTLARWLSQTLSQLRGRYWRMSHPFIHSYRFAAKAGHERQIWLKRLANHPPEFPPAKCCRSPLFVILSRDLLKTGLICMHCEETAVDFDELPADVKTMLQPWMERYGSLHEVAHREDDEQDAAVYDDELQKAKEIAQAMLSSLEKAILPNLLEFVPAIAWEDQDECLDIAPEEIKTGAGN
ncbi:MAG: hypothetical protein ACO1QB_09040 [Verrucomicrobiales bacterium]